jgi:hypothetical protein
MNKRPVFSGYSYGTSSKIEVLVSFLSPKSPNIDRYFQLGTKTTVSEIKPFVKIGGGNVFT